MPHPLVIEMVGYHVVWICGTEMVANRDHSDHCRCNYSLDLLRQLKAMTKARQLEAVSVCPQTGQKWNTAAGDGGRN